MDETHISSLIVQALPAAAPEVQGRLQQLPDAEIASADPEHGKWVVVLEASSLRIISDQLDTIRQWPGVINATLVYHHAEPTHALQENVR